MPSMNVLSRAQTVRAVWVGALIVLLGAVPASAANPARAQAEQGQQLPVTTTVPVDSAVKVRPDTTVSFQLDTHSPEYHAFRQQLESGRFAIQVEGGSSTRLFVGEQRANKSDAEVASAGEATFDAQTGTVSTPALNLGRYTTYTVTLAVKAAYEALLHGQPLPGNDSVSFAFVTGSALHEPTHYQLQVDGVAPRVTETARLVLAATDDYGLPAWGSNVSVQLTEDGTRRPFSAVATPAQAVLSEPNGVATFDLSDTEAEGVQVSLQAIGLYPEDAWSGSAALSFRPGPAASMAYGQVPASVMSEMPFTVCVNVSDVYGNPVEDGTAVVLSGGASTATAATKGGSACGSLVAPYGQGGLPITMTSGSARLTVGTQLLAPLPTSITLTVYPPSGSVPADGSTSATIVANVKDSKGRPVLDGRSVSWSTTLGTLSATSTSTQFGQTAVTLRSSTTGGAVVTARTAGVITQTASVGFYAAQVSSITNITYSQPCWSSAGYMSYGPLYGDHFRAQQGLCGVLVSGTARDANGGIVRNASIMVSVRIEGSWNPVTVTTDSYGRFTALVPVPKGPGMMVTTVYGSSGTVYYHHWDWGYLYFISNGNLINPTTERIYTLSYVVSQP